MSCRVLKLIMQDIIYVIGSEKRDHFALKLIFQYSPILAAGSYIRTVNHLCYIILISGLSPTC